MSTSDAEDDRLRSDSPVESGNEDSAMLEGTPVKGEDERSVNGSSASAKDPNRPRRKKARRACYACQRAHLTCGDERPCQRCIKRGLQDVCQDGVRKKAKYLHDAPNDALLPGAATRYSNAELKHSRSDSTPQTDDLQAAGFMPSSQTFNVFNGNTHMPPPSINERSMSNTSFKQPSPGTVAFNVTGQGPIQGSVVTPDAPGQQMTNTGWARTLFDPTDPSLFNFDLASMNFGNHYGALEFGMLGHMATGAGETPDSETATQRGSVSQYPVTLGSFSDSPSNQFAYSGDMMMTGDWASGPVVYNSITRGENPHAFAIETNAQLTSPENTNTPPDGAKHDSSPIMTTAGRAPTSEINRFIDTGADGQTRPPAHISTPQLKARSHFQTKRSARRTQDPTSIYTSVTSPYPYTAGFHQLIAYLQRRFQSTPSKTLAIAKSLASIRPSFIATNKTLTREDLIFMEKCFQRTLWEYEGFIEGVGTPTIVARRTGEIAAVGKEFQILTGWKKDILLGRAPNLNVNRGHSGRTPAESGANSANRGTGANTPLQRPPEESTESRQQPVFLAELLDDDTCVQFYEDFARLAFGDSRGSVMGKGKLLKYRTKDDEIAANLKAEATARGEDEPQDLKRQDSFVQARPHVAKKGISGEKGMQRLGSSDGKVDCAYCWTVKRDVFDIPMLIVMNFLPCI